MRDLKVQRDIGYVVIADFSGLEPERQVWRGGVFDSPAEAKAAFDRYLEARGFATLVEIRAIPAL